MLKLRGDFLVSNSALDFIIKNVCKIFEEEQVESNSSLISVLKNFNSKDKRLSYYKSNFGFVEPETIVISQGRTSSVIDPNGNFPK